MRKSIKTISKFTTPILAAVSTLVAADLPGQAPHSGNPILPGYYADPSIVQNGGKYFIYATLDPWGGDTLGRCSSGRYLTRKMNDVNAVITN